MVQVSQEGTPRPAFLNVPEGDTRKDLSRDRADHTQLPVQVLKRTKACCCLKYTSSYTLRIAAGPGPVHDLKRQVGGPAPVGLFLAQDAAIPSQEAEFPKGEKMWGQV